MDALSEKYQRGFPTNEYGIGFVADAEFMNRMMNTVYHECKKHSECATCRMKVNAQDGKCALQKATEAVARAMAEAIAIAMFEEQKEPVGV